MSERTIAVMPSGARSTDIHVNIGSITSTIAGVTMLCVSLRSLHAAPMAMKIDPKISPDITRNSVNQASAPGVTALA